MEKVGIKIKSIVKNNYIFDKQKYTTLKKGGKNYKRKSELFAALKAFGQKRANANWIDFSKRPSQCGETCNDL